MRYVLPVLITLPLLSFGQIKADYKDFMKRFVGYYNKRQTDSICTLFPVKKGTDDTCFWKWAELNQDTSDYDRYGRITAYEYLGIDKKDPEKVAVFKVVFVNEGVKVISFNLANKKFATFRFDTSSGEIKRMLKKAD